MREISWIGAARKEFDGFPDTVREQVRYSLDVVAFGRHPDTAKPLKGFVEGVFEISVSFRKDTWRTAYAVKLGEQIWVIHAFQKKSTRGIRTPKHEIELIRQRIKRLKELLK